MCVVCIVGYVGRQVCVVVVCDVCCTGMWGDRCVWCVVVVCDVCCVGCGETGVCGVW